MQTTLRSKQPWGWATVTHPFHPLLGQRFQVLRMRKTGGREVFSVFDERLGVFALPRDWTDQATPSAGSTSLEPPPILDARCLLQLRELVESLKKLEKEVDDAK